MDSESKPEQGLHPTTLHRQQHTDSAVQVQDLEHQPIYQAE
jgi:hypothetical protein